MSGSGAGTNYWDSDVDVACPVKSAGERLISLGERVREYWHHSACDHGLSGKLQVACIAYSRPRILHSMTHACHANY